MIVLAVGINKSKEIVVLLELDSLSQRLLMRLRSVYDCDQNMTELCGEVRLYDDIPDSSLGDDC